MSEELKEDIKVEEETTEQSGEERRWTEEFSVVADELIETVKKLFHETNVRRVIIKNESRRIHFEIPLMLGIAGIALLPVYASLALIAALVADCTILVERVEKEAETAES